jgi:hypothetical protein
VDIGRDAICFLVGVGGFAIGLLVGLMLRRRDFHVEMDVSPSKGAKKPPPAEADGGRDD